jgi:hypothetical protein
MELHLDEFAMLHRADLRRREQQQYRQVQSEV